MAMPPSLVAPWQLMSYVADVRATGGPITPGIGGSMLWLNDSCGSSGVCAAHPTGQNGLQSCISRAQHAIPILDEASPRIDAAFAQRMSRALEGLLLRCRSHRCDTRPHVHFQVRGLVHSAVQPVRYSICLHVRACCGLAASALRGVRGARSPPRSVRPRARRGGAP